MSVLIICFSCVSAFADTTVDSSDNFYDKEFFHKNVLTDDIISLQDFNLKKLPVDNNGYITIVEQSFDSDGNLATIIKFIPNAKRKIVTVNSFNDVPSSITDDTIYTYYSGSDVFARFKGSYYSLILSQSGSCGFTSHPQNTSSGSNGIYIGVHSVWGKSNNVFVSSLDFANMFLKDAFGYQEYRTFHKNGHQSGVNYCGYNSKLFNIVVSLVSGYTGKVIDNDLSTLLGSDGIDCDNSILKKYKYQISYLKNNDIVMMFLNNNKKPDLKVEDYKDGIYSGAKKYTFTYNNVYDSIVYFPQYQKYLNYSVWYDKKPETNNFKWFWENDNKSFSLISDWNVSFDDVGKANYNGTRVVVNWKFDENSLDKISLSNSWQVDKEQLKDKGWQDGRPSDQNYPYCVQLWQNNIPVYSVYFNSKPKVRINRESDYYCEYAIDMIGMCGYMYSEWGEMSTQFDFTTGKVAKGSDILSQGQNNVWYLFNELGGRVDDSCLLHLYDNYKGDDEHFVGTKVFFNWDVTSNLFDTNLKNQPDFDYSKTILKGEGSQYKDENGHIHGGSLKNYDEEDLNKWNTNGKDDSENNTSSSSDFDFSFEGITEYCKGFWSFMQSSLAIFPSFIWLLVGASVSVLIALRLLGR